MGRVRLRLQRPLAIFDIESTGVNRRTDRIIDLAIIIVHPNGQQETHAFRVNPGIPIPPESAAIHGIRDADVAEAPPFSAIAPEVVSLLEGCDLGGFNVHHFDIPLLCEECKRAGVPFTAEGRATVDVQRIFHTYEPRDLSAALRFYCGVDHEDAHGALEDVKATIRVLEGQYEKYPDLPTDVDQLDALCNPRRPEWVDRTGKLKWEADEVVINFGRNQGRKLRDLAENERSFLTWILKNDFPPDTQRIVGRALEGQFPAPPAASSSDSLR